MSEDDLLEHYSAALDEIYRLRCLLEYNADVLQAHLWLKTFPKSRRPIAEMQVERMRRASEGESRDVYNEVYQESIGFRRAVGRRTLTRTDWELDR